MKTGAKVVLCIHHDLLLLLWPHGPCELFIATSDGVQPFNSRFFHVN